MKQSTITAQYQGRTGAALYAAGYRLGTDGHWRRTIDSGGTGLTPCEQEINRKGGRDYGKDADQIFWAEVADLSGWLEQFAPDDDRREAWWVRQWLATYAAD